MTEDEMIEMSEIVATQRLLTAVAAAICRRESDPLLALGKLALAARATAQVGAGPALEDAAEGALQTLLATVEAHLRPG